MKRAEQKKEDTWNLEDIYVNEEAFYADYQQCKEMIQSINNAQGTLCKSGECLFKFIDLYEKTLDYFQRLSTYVTLSSNQDMADPKYQKMNGKVRNLGNLFSEACSFMEPEILSNASLIPAFFKDYPALEKYRRFIEEITSQKDHILDEKTEALLAKVNDLKNANAIFDMFTQADLRFHPILDQDGKEHELTHGNYIRYLTSKDRILRENAFKEMWGTYGSYNNTLGEMLKSELKECDFSAKVRNFKSTQEMEMYYNEIPLSVYENLLEAIHKHLPSLHRYVALRKKIMQVDELHMYDLYYPLTSMLEKRYDYETGKKLCLEGLSILGDEYISILKEGFDHRWIDVYENEGKTTGAYSHGCYGVHPYVLMNYTDTLDDVFTIAHEMGHSIHTYYSNQAQSLLNSRYKIFVAEVASTCNESLLIHYLMEKCEDREEKKFLINYFLDQFKGTMFRQTLFAEFEYQAHDLINRGESVTAKALNEIYWKLNQQYYGEDMISDEGIKYEWSKIPHYYMPFYIYQYATGFAAAIAISTKILNHEEGILEKYKAFLSGGCTKSPIDLLKICGVDMTSIDPIDEALNVFAKYISELEKLI